MMVRINDRDQKPTETSKSKITLLSFLYSAAGLKWEEMLMDTPRFPLA